ncbi:RecQ family ATP-dependent DNA helicase [Allorhodopirellula solitaria]|uniref:DNA 3'-5' helicase n=1 Tax=Allorhodopirellula solitaria TaxID=2527987 RepID=A0A5C5XQM1_9BACT|nr:RecQ family ATP-dependent DNA helicase [Allorhodopirellula solitaria]TWT65194.1 ATP-dependent DNA helicase RecQ [Allorhodopirellula solitaria]
MTRGGVHDEGRCVPVGWAAIIVSVNTAEHQNAYPDQEETRSRWQTADELLAERFGHPRWLPAQRKVVDAVLRGQNTLAVLPTGHGKSLCYQLPSQILPGLTLVISPLVSLMKDQCESLARKGIEALRIDQTISATEFQQTWKKLHSGRAKLLYLAPERFFNERFPAQLGGLPISLLAIDEAHCMSQWGHHFRPDYLRIPELVDRYQIGQTLALTATATPIVVRDIRKAFSINTQHTVRLSPHRSNLRLQCRVVESDQRDRMLLEQLPAGRKRRGATLIYVTRRSTADQLAESLCGEGFEPLVYHAGLSPAQRDDVQREFLQSPNTILIGTIAFGMGVDKPDIRRVIHYNPSQSIEAYSQEIGRGGRDGKPCQCETLYVRGDEVALANLAAGDLPSVTSLRSLVERLQGQPDRFYLSLGKLGWEINLSTPALATLMIRLQGLGYLRCLPMRYDTYRITPRFTNDVITDRCRPEHADAVAAVLASLAKGRRGFRVNLVVTAEQYRIDREHLIAAIEQTAIAGWWTVDAADSMHGYERAKPIKRPKSLIETLRRHAMEQFEQNRERVDDLTCFLQQPDCLAIGLAKHFGHRRTRPCGRCSACFASGSAATADSAMAGASPDRDEPAVGGGSIGRSAIAAMENAIKRHPDLFSDPLDQAKFLCGLSTPFFRRFRLAQDPGYGVCVDVPFQRVLSACQREA